MLVFPTQSFFCIKLWSSLDNALEPLLARHFSDAPTLTHLIASCRRATLFPFLSFPFLRNALQTECFANGMLRNMSRSEKFLGTDVYWRPPKLPFGIFPSQYFIVRWVSCATVAFEFLISHRAFLASSLWLLYRINCADSSHRLHICFLFRAYLGGS